MSGTKIETSRFSAAANTAGAGRDDAGAAQFASSVGRNVKTQAAASKPLPHSESFASLARRYGRPAQVIPGIVVVGPLKAGR